MLNNIKLNIKDIMRKAHKITKELKAQFKNVDYVGQLGISLKFLYSCKTFSEFIGKVGEIFYNKTLIISKIQKIGNMNAYEMKDDNGNIFRWITNFTINTVIGNKVLFKRFTIKANSIIKGNNVNILCKCRI